MQIVKYSISLRNKHRKTAQFYGRIRQDNRERFIPLHTASRAQAEKWLHKQLYLYSEYQAGNLDESEILTVDSTAVIARKRVSGASKTLREVMDAWEADMRLEGAREATIATYMRTARMLLDTSVPVTSVNAEMLRSALAAHAECKPATRRFYSNTLKSLAVYLEERCGFSATLRQAIPDIKVDPTVRPYWTHDQIIAIKANVECRDKVCQRQFREYLELLSITGCRQGEAAELRWEDFLGDRIRFRAENTKGRKTRIVPIPMYFTQMLLERQELRGKIFDAIPKTQSARDKMLRRAMQKAGITSGSLHTFRKSVADDLFRRSGGDLKLVAAITGHSEVTLARYYLKERGIEDMRKLIGD